MSEYVNGIFRTIRSIANFKQLVPNHTCSFLRAGSRFEGTQESDHQVYNVHVEIKHVDMAESYLCGYLRIQGKFFSASLTLKWNDG